MGLTSAILPQQARHGFDRIKREDSMLCRLINKKEFDYVRLYSVIITKFMVKS